MTVALFLTMLALGQHAEHQATPVEQNVEGVEPIRCWRQTTSGAITVGEAFRVILTCAVFESSDAQVVPDESRLNVASIQMSPFEIIGGTHPPDVHRGLRRFFQYEYEIRIISRDAIGHDVNVPPLTISYRIHSRVGAAAKLEGRDLSYVLPALPIKVLSLVPGDAADIRDASEASLAAVDRLRARSRMFEILALALGVSAAVMVVFALIPAARRAGAIGRSDRNVIPDRAIVTGAASVLRDAQTRAAADGWTDDRIASALSAVRVIAAVAGDLPISRKPLPSDGVTPEGRIRVDHGAIRRNSATVSSSVTASLLPQSARLDRLRSSLTALTSAMYRKAPQRDAAVIDDAARDAISVAGQVAAERTWIRSRWARR